MKINSFSYNNSEYNWKLQETTFDKLSLLVGASGVGKTQVLRSIVNLKRISNGKSFNGVKWNIQFETIDNSLYNWEGAFNYLGKNWFFDEDDEDDTSKAEIRYEKIFMNKDLLIDRKDGKILFKGSETVKLSKFESVVSLLKEEEEIKKIHLGFKRIRFSDFTDSNRLTYAIKIFDSKKILNKYNSIDQIRNSDESTIIKLYLTYKNANFLFSEILDRYIDIFPQVEDIKIEPLDFTQDDIPIVLKEFPVLQMKEYGVKNWIPQSRISSGMFRTLMHLSDMYLCPEGSVFLIDEFENSLGVNCINEVTDEILSSPRKTQYIITSHHPYIINRIPMNLWKLVTRTFGKVNIHSINKYKIGNSSHEAFMQLIQLEEFITGMEKM
jgi:hypothetical protein